MQKDSLGHPLQCPLNLFFDQRPVKIGSSVRESWSSNGLGQCFCTGWRVTCSRNGLVRSRGSLRKLSVLPRFWSPVADLFPERSTPELLCQEVRWASLLSYGVSVKLLGDLLPMEHQLSTSTLSRHVHQVAERLESELGDE